MSILFFYFSTRTSCSVLWTDMSPFLPVVSFSCCWSLDLSPPILLFYKVFKVLLSYGFSYPRWIFCHHLDMCFHPSSVPALFLSRSMNEMRGVRRKSGSHARDIKPQSAVVARESLFKFPVCPIEHTVFNDKSMISLLLTRLPTPERNFLMHIWTL